MTTGKKQDGLVKKTTVWHAVRVGGESTEPVALFRDQEMALQWAGIHYPGRFTVVREQR